jgi:broad specificity phosphatase PhoE
MEWDYGAYEGRTTIDIRRERPGWTLWRDGVPDGETAAQVGERVDRVIAELRAAAGDALVFADGHVLRVLAARWLGLEPGAGRLFALDPATISVLAYERETPVIRMWNRSRGQPSSSRPPTAAAAEPRATDPTATNASKPITPTA